MNMIRKIFCIFVLFIAVKDIYTMNVKTISLITADNKEIQIPKSHLQESNFFKDHFKDFPNTTQFNLRYHNAESIELVKCALEKLFSIQNKYPIYLKQFIKNLPADKLYDLIQVANYFDITKIYTIAHTALISHSMHPDNLKKLQSAHNTDSLSSHAFIKDIEYPAIQTILDKVIPYLEINHIKNLNSKNNILLHSTSPFYSVTLNKNETWLAAASDSHIYLLNLLNSETFKLQNSSSTRSVAFSPTNPYLFVSGGSDNLIRLWDITKKACISLLNGHTDTVLFINFSSDGKKLASSSADHTVRIWDITKKKCIHILNKHTNDVWKTCFIQNNTKLLSASSDGKVMSWDVKSGKKIKTIIMGIALEEGYYKIKPAFGELALNPNNSLLAIDTPANPKATIQIFDAKNNQFKKELESHDGIIYDLQFYNNNILISASADKTICFWHIPSKRCLKILNEHDKTIRLIRLSKDKSKLYSASEDGTICTWEIMPTKLFTMLKNNVSLSFARLIYLAYILKKQNKKLDLSKHSHLQKIFDTYDTQHIKQEDHLALQKFLCKNLGIIHNCIKNQYT